MILDATAGNRSIYEYKKSENIPLKRLLAILTEWRLLIEIPVHDPNHTYGESQTYWLIMEKRKQTATSLEQYTQAQTTTPADTSSATSETLLPFVQEPQAPQQ